MSFFWHSNLGMIYFIILSLVCAFAIGFGGRKYRLLACCVLAVFLADRILLATMTDEAAMISFGGAAEFAAAATVIAASLERDSRVVAALIASKIL